MAILLALSLEANAVMDIDEMKAGREMDRLISDTILEIDPSWVHFEPGGKDILIDGQVCRIAPTAHYSTDIAAAWDIVETLVERFHLELNSPFIDGQPWFAGFTEKGVTGWNGIPDFSAKGDTAALAICRAALRAVMK